LDDGSDFVPLSTHQGGKLTGADDCGYVNVKIASNRFSLSSYVHKDLKKNI